MAELLLRILTLIVPDISAELRQALVALLNNLEAQAKKTANKFDDILVALLKAILLG